MIHYHGGRMSNEMLAFQIWRGRHAFISFADAGQIGVAAECSQSFALDNGAFSFWTAGTPTDWPKYYEWVEEWMPHPGFDWAVIPDNITGSEKDNDKLVREWTKMFGWFSGVPVWHLHESVSRLHGLCAEFPRVALGSSGEYRTPGTHSWWERINEALIAVAPGGKPRCKLHGLRMLDVDLFTRMPLASADSTNVSRNNNNLQRWGPYKSASQAARAEMIASTIEAYNSAPVWVGTPKQEGLF